MILISKPLAEIPDEARASVVKFWTPWPPSTNRVWKVGKDDRGRGTVFRSSKYDGFIHDVRALACAGDIPPIKRAPYYTLSIQCYPPDRRKYDVDNRLKATQDALTRVGFWEDDSLVVAVTIDKNSPIEGGMLGVIVTALDDWDFYKVAPEEYRRGATFREYREPGRTRARLKK